MSKPIIGKGVNMVIEGFAIMGFAALVIMMLLGVWGTIAGWAGLSAPGVLEWSEILNVVVICLPIAYVTIKRKHIEIDLVTTFISTRAKRTLHFITLFPLLLFSGLLAWKLTPEALQSFVTLESFQVSSSIRIYWWPGKVSVALGFICMALITVYQIIHYMRGGKLLESKNEAPLESEDKER